MAERQTGRLEAWACAAAALAFLGACASPPPQTRSLRLVAWNMEHLAEANNSGCRPRQEADYVALRAYAQSLEADIVAFQEVESVAAAQRVFDPAHYQIVMETRPGGADRLECRGLPGQFLNRQAVGFAIRNSLRVERLPDVTALQLGDANLRSGVDVRVSGHGAQPLRLLAVHLKSGCAAGSTNEACATLMAQIPHLEAWIDARGGAHERFAVLGDFNRRLSVPGDSVWADLDDEEPIDLRLASGETGPACDPRYNTFIDYIVLAEAEIGQFREWTFAGERLSDHCAIGVDLQ